MEVINDGAVIFFKNLSDFARFNQFTGGILLPKMPQSDSVSEMKEPLEIELDEIHMPVGIPPGKIAELVARKFENMSPYVDDFTVMFS